MNRVVIYLVCAVMLFIGSVAFAQHTREEREGQELVADLRAAAPQEDSEIRGILTVRSRRDRTTNAVPVVTKIVPGQPGWDAIYEAAPTKSSGAEKLVVRRCADRPNQYFYARAKSPGEPLPPLHELEPRQADIPFAGSDFWLTDLGLDFLHWPIQHRLGGEGRLGRATHVLESVDPFRVTLPRVKSWVDKETGGILAAEAYEANSSRPAKEFTLSGSSFKKVNGVWQLEKMTIRSPRTRSESTLQFDLSKTRTASSERQ